MRDQLELLRSTPWDALIVCDSLRADEAQDLVPEVEAVRSPAPITYQWVRAFAREWAEEELLLVCANPVVNRELAGTPVRWAQVPCWLWDWETRPDGLGTVPAEAVLRRLWRVVNRHGRPRRLVVWLLEPHVPYPGMPYTDWGRGMRDGMSRANAGHVTIRQALERGLVSWDAVLAARARNVRIALDAARRVHEGLGGTAVLTSDHGELLGEEGVAGIRLFGHSGQVAWHPNLKRVPWVVAEGEPAGDYSPLPDLPAWWKDDGIERKLEALGYA